MEIGGIIRHSEYEHRINEQKALSNSSHWFIMRAVSDSQSQLEEADVCRSKLTSLKTTGFCNAIAIYLYCKVNTKKWNAKI
jgi:hypothetical protein